MLSVSAAVDQVIEDNSLKLPNLNLKTIHEFERLLIKFKRSSLTETLRKNIETYKMLNIEFSYAN